MKESLLRNINLEGEVVENSARDKKLHFMGKRTKKIGLNKLGRLMRDELRGT